MEELLSNILELRSEIDKLTESGNKEANENYELAIKIADAEKKISNMNSEQYNLEQTIKDFKLQKSLLYTRPIGLAISTFFLLTV